MAHAQVRARAMDYDQRQSLALWTAESKEEKAAAIFGAVAPMISQFAVSGSFRDSLQGKGKLSALATAIHAADKLPSGKMQPIALRRRNAAARAVFSHALNLKPRAYEFDQDAHDAFMLDCEVMFYAHIAASTPAPKARAPKADTPAADASGAASITDESDVIDVESRTVPADAQGDALADAIALVLTAAASGMLSAAQADALRLVLTVPVAAAAALPAPAADALPAALDAALAAD